MKYLLLLSVLLCACDSTTSNEPQGTASGTWQWTLSGDTSTTQAFTGGNGTVTLSATAAKTYSGTMLSGSSSYTLTATIGDDDTLRFVHIDNTSMPNNSIADYYAVRYEGNVWRGRWYQLLTDLTTNETRYIGCEMDDHKPCIFFLYR